jgi:hypothetical protein
MDYLRITTPLGPAPATLFPGGQPSDLIALGDLKLELDLSETADDPYLKKLVTRASAAATKFCNRSFTPALWQDVVHPAVGPHGWQLPASLSRLQLAQWPLTSTPSPAGTAPPQTPALSATPYSGAPAQQSFVRLTYVTPAGETAASLESSLKCTAGQALVIAAPGPDGQGLATGYNVYIGTASFAETLVNAAPLALTQSFFIPGSVTTVTTTPAPNYLTVIEGVGVVPTPLAEGVDFTVDARLGQIDRLCAVAGRLRAWSRPATIVYSAGYAAIPDDLQEAVILLAKTRWFARARDPMVRSENVSGVYEAAYWLGTGIGGQGDLPIDVAEKLERYRVKAMA